MIHTQDQPHGMVRGIDSLTQKYDHGKHKMQYDKLGNFVVEFVQRQMVDAHNLQEVWVPENHHVDE